MRFFGNILWFLVGGWWLAIMWGFFGLLAALTIIGLPLMRASFQMAKLSAFPFGKDVVHVRELDLKDISASTAMTGTIGFIVNILWACTAGIVLFISYLIAGVLACCTIIGIPFGLQSFKLAGLSFWPVGRRVVTKEVAEEARRRSAAKRLDAMQRA